MPRKSKKPGLPREVHLVTDVPLVIVMKYVGTHWTIARVVVVDENPNGRPIPGLGRSRHHVTHVLRGVGASDEFGDPMTGYTYGEKLSDFKVGDRVELHPGTDLWMRGNRFGMVEVIGKRYVHVRMDRSGGIYSTTPRHIRIIEDGEPDPFFATDG